MKQFFLCVVVALATTLPSYAQIDGKTSENVNEYPLPEVEVLSIDTKTRIVGRTSNKGAILIGAEGADGAGKEMGLKFKTKKRSWVKRVSFAIVECDSMLTRMPFRLNIYKYRGKECTNNRVSSIEFLYTKGAISDGRFTFDLPTLLPLEKGEYILALEFLEPFPDKKFQMRTNIMTGTTYTRNSSTSTWTKIPLGSTIAVELIEKW